VNRRPSSIDHLKKTDMAKEAERLLAGTGWLPDPLLTVDFGEVLDVDTEADGEPGALPEFLASGDKGDHRRRYKRTAVAGRRR
jgi:ParB family chromosome partitioning protein